jgi:hypothetical protein
MLYREIVAVCSQIHTKHINTAVWAERGGFKRSRKITKSNCQLHYVRLSACPSLRMEHSALTGRIFMTFDI